MAAQQAQVVAEACRYMDAAETPPTLRELAGAVGLSPYHLHRLFRQATGLTPKAYASASRAERLRTALPQRPTVTEAIYEAGFNSSGRFYAQSNTLLGMKPTTYRNGGAQQAIRFAIGTSTLGPVLVASTEKGVCAILMDDDPSTLITELQSRFPKANLVEAEPAYREVIERVIAYVETPENTLELPLDLQGTAFQRRVWEALRQIPCGSTATYTGIAEQLGLPKAAWAVARACATNPVAVAVPCHRVIRADGNLSGYRWGLARKEALLRREKALF